MKKINFIILFSVVVPSLIFASSASVESVGKTDIIPRTINFLIFASILYYILADIIKNAYNGRIKGIADNLQEIQQKAEASKKAADNAKEQVQEARRNKEVILETAQNEAKQLVAKIHNGLENELKNLEIALEEKMEAERRKVAIDTTKEVLQELFDNKNISLSDKEMVDIIMRKVS